MLRGLEADAGIASDNQHCLSCEVGIEGTSKGGPLTDEERTKREFHRSDLEREFLDTTVLLEGTYNSAQADTSRSGEPYTYAVFRQSVISQYQLPAASSVTAMTIAD